MNYSYQKEQVTIIGLGVTGLSCVDFFLSRGIIPRVMDTRLSPPGLKALSIDVPCHLGSLNERWLLDATLIVVSPGISITHPALISAAEVGIEIIGDIELFAREVKSLPIVAITGSNGKSTVTCLLKEMAICAGWKVGTGGNIGLPALLLLNAAYQFYVLELSSFQLETTYSLKTVAATILNIGIDHMDRYPLGLQQYRAAKLAIYRDAEVCAVNSEDLLTLPTCDEICCVSFGAKYGGDYSLSQYNDRIYLMAKGESIMDCAEMHINGQHNYINALAALTLADIVGIPRFASLKALRQFQGLAHRFELVHERNGIRWINDSKATNISSTKAALNGLNVAGILHLLLGGDGKSVDFSSLISCLEGRNVQLYCFGQDGAKIAALYPAAILTETLEKAMCIIGTRVKRGDLVLLSPACASQDQFKNFAIRGKTFTRLAREVG